ncbi:MAG: glycerate kinase [Pleurocapsa sp. CRU_1_2]|nr:glycerate kinase [Pleurocapsa sp. CRU_1_2]
MTKYKNQWGEKVGCSPCQLSEAIADAANLLTNSAESMARLMLVGQQVISNK